jgi:ABC-2 type transport system ATP-binding protein
VIDVEALVFDHPSGPALKGVSFVVRAGAVVGLVGPPGSGKSTLLRCIATLETPGAGRITVAGRDTERDPRGVHAILGYLPRAFGLYDALTVGQCLRYAARSRGVAEAHAEEAAVRAAETVGLAGRMPTRAGALSPRERQRLALAQAIVHRPRVLLLDDPGADAADRDALGPLIRRFAAEGLTVMVSAPDLAGLPDGCTERLALDGGQVASDGVERLAPSFRRPQAERA